MGWRVDGTYIEACNCEAACPCVFLSPPTEESCTVVLGWYIESNEHEGFFAKWPSCFKTIAPVAYFYFALLAEFTPPLTG